jgi:hypothetical protein
VRQIVDELFGEYAIAVRDCVESPRETGEYIAQQISTSDHTSDSVAGTTVVFMLWSRPHSDAS